MLRGLTKCKKQHNSKKVNNNKDIRILVFKNSKVIINTVSAKPTFKKLLTILTKMILVENRQNISIKKVWI